MTSDRTAKPRFFYGYIIVFISFIIIVVAYATFLTYGVFFKPIIAELGWTRAAISGASSLSSLLLGLFNIVTGRLTDRFGPRLVSTVCGFFLGLGYLLLSQVSAVWQLYLSYGALVAIGMSGAMVPLSSTVGRWFVKRRGLMMGIVVAGVGVGTVVGPPAATWLIAIYGWRTSLIVLGIGGLLSTMLAAQFLKRDPAKIGQLPYGEAEDTSGNIAGQNHNSETNGLSFKETMTTKPFWLLLLAYFCLFCCFTTIFVHIVPYTTDVGMSAMTAANIFSTIGIGSILGIVAMGIIADKIGNKLSLIIGFVLLTATLFWLLLVKEVYALYLFAAVFGFGYGGLATVFPLTIAQLFGLSSYGAILGGVTLGGLLGGTIAPVLAGWIFDISNSYSFAFMIIAALALIALLLVLSLRIRQGQGK